MRIIGGSYRGKKLFSPQSDAVRPTSDRAREALFNILNFKLSLPWSSYSILDVFAGTGAFGLEALSRGCSSIGLVDINTQSLEKNVALFAKEQDKIKIYRQNAQAMPKALKQYNLLFMDAPYNKNLSAPALESLAKQGWLAPQTLCLVEIEKSETLDIPPQYQFLEERIYGLAKIIFLIYSGQ